MSGEESSFENGEGDTDPRVQEELERLNNAGTDINVLETALTKARTEYRTYLHKISHDLRALEKTLGSCVKKSRPYYESRNKFKEAQHAVQLATEKFEHAASRHNAAREMVAVAEASLESTVGADAQDKLAWAEMLNQATEKVNIAEKERQEAAKLHTQKIQKLQEIERTMRSLQKSQKRSIISSKPYFELKVIKMAEMEDKRNTVNEIEQKLHISKSDYQAALRTLETISEQIHLHRKLQSLESNLSGKSDHLTVPNAAGTGNNQSDTSSCRSVLSDLRRADSVEHIDNMSDPSDADQNDRLSVDSGMWTPGSGSGGSRHDVLSRKQSGALKIANLKYPPPNPQISDSYSADLESIPLAKEDFWDGYHRKQKQDWFLNQNQALDFIKRHTSIADTDRDHRVSILDLGVGTSTLMLRIIFMMKNLDGWAIDFSEEACRFQAKSVETLLENYSKKTGDSESLLVKNGNSLVICKDDCRSLTCADNSIDYIIDKGTMDAFMRLEESDSFQAMDEMVRVLGPSGKVLQLTEEPPETRVERWFKWSQTSKYEAKVQQEEIAGKYGYIVTVTLK
ncbi:Oidioi.mRNA.OKI2018_I69.PAR.g12338.t1.cds [Oikopleura dioica]|uniref:Oidioi.mRNA.OKI2018_I69.PAR.g12338.t1.cds n=1 Tax=Oikopleura dioica TaxID=34765 RepID=A0ABN7S781_OIKDI|nr:Oidioi.mRNA.OKI2018_I69.PAR.g12338.t1.cds [Oikopleura dioica]